MGKRRKYFRRKTRRKRRSRRRRGRGSPRGTRRKRHLPPNALIPAKGFKASTNLVYIPTQNEDWHLVPRPPKREELCEKCATPARMPARARDFICEKCKHPQQIGQSATQIVQRVLGSSNRELIPGQKFQGNEQHFPRRVRKRDKIKKMAKRARKRTKAACVIS